MNQLLFVFSWFVIGFASGVIVWNLLAFHVQKRANARREEQLEIVSEGLDKVLEVLRSSQNSDEQGNVLSPYQFRKEQ